MNKKKMGSSNKTLTHELLKYHINYDPKTGIFIWIRPTASWMNPGDIAGNIYESEDAGTYVCIKIFGVKHKAHRLAWFYMKGEWPDHEIDHKDTVGTNNKWGNLRACTVNQNACNKKIYKSNKTGQKGVFFDTRQQKFAATISINKKRIYLGAFVEFEEAANAYKQAAKKLHKEFAPTH